MRSKDQDIQYSEARDKVLRAEEMYAHSRGIGRLVTGAMVGLANRRFMKLEAQSVPDANNLRMPGAVIDTTLIDHSVYFGVVQPDSEVTWFSVPDNPIVPPQTTEK